MSKHIQRTMLMFFVFTFLLSGCLSPSTPTPTLKPSSTPTPIATPTPQPTPTITPASLAISNWEEFRFNTLCLQLKETYKKVQQPVEQPVRETLQKLFDALGIRILPENSTDCPVTLKIYLTYTPLSALYNYKDICYTGASVSGSMTISAPRMPTKSVEFREQHDVTKTTKTCPNSMDAPFSSVWPKAIVDGLRKLWGASALLASFYVPFTRSPVLFLLDEINLKPYADELVPVFAGLLSNTEVETAKYAAIALSKFKELAAPAVPELREALLSADAEQMIWLMQAISSIGPEAIDAVPALLKAITHSDNQVRLSAVLALGAIGDKRGDVITALITQAIEGGSPGSYAIEALKNLTGKKFVTGTEWQAWWVTQPTPTP